MLAFGYCTRCPKKLMNKITHSDANSITKSVPMEFRNKRLDVALAQLFPQYSRARLQAWLKQGAILTDGVVQAAKYKLNGNEQITANFDPVAALENSVVAEDIKLDIVYEDAAILLVNKPPFMVMHTAAGNYSQTLENGLLYYHPPLGAVPRAGIVHRLDKNTSGLVVVAKTLAAHKSLVEQLQARSVVRVYDALCSGNLIAGGSIETLIGRSERNRKRMAVRQIGGKPALTHYRVAQKFRYHTHIRAKLVTGRTHQIRVHMAHLRYPLFGDADYAPRFKLPAKISPELSTVLQGFKRQALHAAKLGFNHPQSGEYVEFNTALPKDMQTLFAAVKKDTLNSAAQSYWQAADLDNLFANLELADADS